MGYFYEKSPVTPFGGSIILRRSSGMGYFPTMIED
jgi:hypothetical protein